MAATAMALKSSPAEPVQEPKRPAGRLAVLALMEGLGSAIQQAQEITEGGEIYDDDLRDIATDVIRYNSRLAQTVYLAMLPEPMKTGA